MRRDEAYLLDIKIPASEALEFVGDMTFHEFLNDRMALRAVLNCLHEVGEASKKLSDKFKAQHPLVPWSDLVVHRNELAHEYFRADYGESWHIIKNILPGLVEYIEPLIPPDKQ
ncbi:DUF86 domain-containing protein [bacterium]|nr:DUF86 domain-containing protein [bacterium]